MKHIITILIPLIFMQSCAPVKTYKINEEFEVKLENEGMGGYQWHYKSIPEVEKVDSTKTTHSDSDKLSTYTRNFILKGVETGKYTLEFHKTRTFESSDTIPENLTKQLKIKIKNP